jgi:4-oxalocrotonate tautomerase
MPHVIVKTYAGKTEEQKVRLAEALANDVKAIFGAPDHAISVAIEDVPQQEWDEKVYKPEILPIWDKLYRKPNKR